MKYKRILLKLSGESLMGNKQFGIDHDRLTEYAAAIKEVAATGVQIAIVIGGGNIFRGIQAEAGGMDRVQGDYMGMLATVINSMALQSSLEKAGVETRLQSAISVSYWYTTVRSTRRARCSLRRWRPHRTGASEP